MVSEPLGQKAASGSRNMWRTGTLAHRMSAFQHEVPEEFPRKDHLAVKLCTSEMQVYRAQTYMAPVQLLEQFHYTSLSRR